MLLDWNGDRIASLDSLLLGERRALGTVTTFGVFDQGLYVGTGESAFVDVYSLNGQKKGAIPAGIPGRPVSDKAYADAINLLLGSVKGKTRQRDYLESFPKPKFMPPYNALKSTPSGTLWLWVSPFFAEKAVYRLVDSAGTVLGDVTFLGAGVRLLQVSDHFVLVSYRDVRRRHHIAMFRVYPRVGRS